MRHLTLIIFICLIVTLDQVSKLFIIRFLVDPIHINDWLSIILLYNTGISFGFFQGDSELNRWILIVLSAIISSVVCVFAFCERGWLLRFAFGFVVGGAVGNILDRISSRHAVVDFIDFHIGSWHWPAFNVADSLIVIGAFLMVLDLCFFHSRRPTKD